MYEAVNKVVSMVSSAPVRCRMCRQYSDDDPEPPMAFPAREIHSGRFAPHGPSLIRRT
jgi:hypothetical protein